MQIGRLNRAVRFDNRLAGTLNKRIAFDKRPDTANDGYGNTQGDWEEQFWVWSSKRYLLGGEDVMAARLSGSQPLLLTVRSSSNTRQIAESWRCRDLASEEIFNIRSVTPAQDRNGFIDILCEKGAAV